MTILKTEKLTYVYSPSTPFEKTAVKDVDIEINKGEFIGLIGHTGSGKSTLTQMFNGLLKPTSGKIFVNGRDIWEKPREIRKVRFEVGLVFQYPEYQLFEETVFKDIAFGPTNMGLSKDEIEQRVLDAAKFVDIDEDVLQKSPFELSGGQKRRVSIASIIAMRPSILVLDEPTAGLDPRGRDEILSKIKEFHKANDTTVILVSHSMEDIAKNAERIIVVNKSRIAMTGSVDEIFERASELTAMGLSIPHITRVFIGLKEQGYNVNTNIYTVDQAKDEVLRLYREKEARHA